MSKLSHTPDTVRAIVGAVGLLCYLAAAWMIQPYQWNLITYLVEKPESSPQRVLSLVLLVVLTLAPPLAACLCAIWKHRSSFRTVSADATSSRPLPYDRGTVLFGTLISALLTMWPLLLSAPLVILTCGNGKLLFPASLLHIIGAGWSLACSLNAWPRGRLELEGRDSTGTTSQSSSLLKKVWHWLPANVFTGKMPVPHGYSPLLQQPASLLPDGRRTDPAGELSDTSEAQAVSMRDDASWTKYFAPISLAVLVVLLTVVHTALQVNFFEHLMLGHADIGHFTEELKNALSGRGLRSDSFANTRLGWHFTPLLYVLVPGYWLWPTPQFLMVCSALFVHAAALPIYGVARRISGSTLAAWLFGLAWLVHPSTSRMPYSGTYGFQWLYAALPLLMWWMGAGLAQRWKTYFVLLAVILLCRETLAATTLGFGCALVLFRSKRYAGLVTIAVSLLYGFACVKWIIPHFATSETYERIEMFGSLGNTLYELATAPLREPGAFWGRFVRYESVMCVAILLTTLAWRPIRAWRLGAAALLPMMLVLLLENAQWLSIKYWYQVSFLPALFLATIVGASPPREAQLVKSDSAEDASRQRHTHGALVVLMCCAWGHYLFGFSPVSKSYDLYAASVQMQSVNPAFEAITKWQREIPRSSTILATERIAAHFTDYRRIYTGKRPAPADYVLIDARDSWDSSELPGRIAAFRSDPAYRVFDEFGSIVVFARLAERRVEPED